MSLSDCIGPYFERPSALGFKCSWPRMVWPNASLTSWRSRRG